MNPRHVCFSRVALESVKDSGKKLWTKTRKIEKINKIPDTPLPSLNLLKRPEAVFLHEHLVNPRADKTYISLKAGKLF